MKFKAIFIISLLLNFASFSQNIDHVIIIGIDGMSPDGMKNAYTPVMDKLMENGSFSMHVRNVLPTSSSPNWASMIMGAGPEQHGITSNDWQPDKHELPPLVETEPGIFPTIFWVIKENDPKSEVGAIYQWADFGRLFEKSAVDFDTTLISEHKTADVASNYIRSKKPKFLFVHIDHVDGAGHKFGHGTEKYYGGVAKADVLIGQIIESVEKAGMKENTLIIVSADHGGKGTSHGGESLGEVEVPILLSGPKVKKGFEIHDPINIYDIASTVAFVFAYPQPRVWIGKPINSAFVER
jgi:predicted AlkP superfamily pyrophosphatase or phosphodiesterase